MEKIQWEEPKIMDLGVEMTEHGQNRTDHVDDSIPYNGFTYFSFS